MYDELVKRLRYDAELLLQDGWATGLFMEAADAIEELSKPCWIPMTERLPEENGRYIVAYEDATSILDFFNGKWFFPWHSSPGCTAWEEEGTIQAWMPLPTPPKEEEELAIKETATKRIIGEK